MSTHFIKQGAPYLAGGRYLQGLNSSLIGDAMTAVPAGVVASQANQNIPGDMYAIDTDLASFLSDTVNYYKLYGGIYMFVKFAAAPVATVAAGKLMFWDTSVADDLYQVTPDESGGQGAGNMAGVAIATQTNGYYGLIQIGGKATFRYRTILTGVATNGCGVFAAAAGAGADVGTVDIFAGDNNPASFADVAVMEKLFLGTALALPVAAALGLVQMKTPLFKRF